LLEYNRKETLLERLSIRRLLYLIEQTSYALIDQFNFEAVTVSGRLVHFTLQSLLLTFIFGLFLNKIGADLVILREPHNIESIEELIRNDSKTKPVVMKQFFLLNLMKEASVYRPTSILARLNQVIQADSKNLIISFDAFAESSDAQKLMTEINDLLTRVSNHTQAVLNPAFFFPFFRHAVCLINTELTSRFQATSETFAHGTLNYIFSHNIHPLVRKMMSYFTSTFFETALLKSMEAATLEDNISTMPGFQFSTEVLECQEGVIRSVLSDNNEGWRSFRDIDYLHIHETCLFLLCVAAIVLFIERSVCNRSKSQLGRAHQRLKINITANTSEVRNVWKIVAEEIEKKHFTKQ
jgi:hypothetical protein